MCDISFFDPHPTPGTTIQKNARRHLDWQLSPWKQLWEAVRVMPLQRRYKRVEFVPPAKPPIMFVQERLFRTLKRAEVLDPDLAIKVRNHTEFDLMRKTNEDVKQYGYDKEGFLKAFDYD